MFSIIEKGLDISNDTTHLSSNVIQELYRDGTKNLSDRASYAFNDCRYNAESWSVSVWATCVTRSAISKNGTEEDTQNLPAPTRHDNAMQGSGGAELHPVIMFAHLVDASIIMITIIKIIIMEVATVMDGGIVDMDKVDGGTVDKGMVDVGVVVFVVVGIMIIHLGQPSICPN